MGERTETINDVPSRVADYYVGKSIFITGASGFLGTVLLECLLRCCPGIEVIYILVRPRRGIDPQQRKHKILEKTIFDTLKRENPSFMDKIVVVEGDIIQPKFGISDPDIETLYREVSIVFHCAASIALTKPLESIVKLNSFSVNTVIELCKQMKKLEVLVYTSTAFSNSNRPIIREEIYRLPFPAQRFIDALKVSKEELYALFDECHPRWPNTYTFSKCLSENLLADNADGIPFAIVRPSIIGSVYKRPLPGYVEDSSGVVTLGMAVGKGFIRVIWSHTKPYFNVVSADATANAHVVSAWCLGTGRHKSPLIVNAAQSKDEETFGEIVQATKKFLKQVTVPNAYSKPTEYLFVTKSYFLYKIVSFVQHYIPAYVIDTFLEFKGKKPIMVGLYQFYDKTLLSIYDISSRNYKFICDNFESMNEILCPEDAEIFSTDLEGYNSKKGPELVKAAPYLDFKIDKRTPEVRRTIMNQRFWAIRFIKISAILLFFAILYLSYSFIFKVTSTFSNIIDVWDQND